MTKPGDIQIDLLRHIENAINESFDINTTPEMIFPLRNYKRKALIITFFYSEKVAILCSHPVVRQVTSILN
jgi:hypothetical protein